MNSLIKINKSIKYKKIIYFIIFIGFFIININDIFSNINIFLFYVKSKKEFLNIENILLFCNNNTFKVIKKYKKIYEPKISLISPIYNREKYLLRLLKSIQFQSFVNIEIILIDDYSIDNSIKKIEEFKKEDERILLIKNKKNKGTFNNRNLGTLFSKGKYVILPDPDDIISKNTIKICYKLAEKYDYELIRFSLYIKYEGFDFNHVFLRYKDKSVFQPELSVHIFYGNNELQNTDAFIINKFIKRELYIKALNNLNKFYFKIYMTFMEDTLFNYILYRIAKSFYFIKRIGYYYIRNTQSITKNLDKIYDLRLKFIFYIWNFIFENSKNTKFEKDMFNLFFIKLNKKFNIGNQLKSAPVNHDLNFYLKILKIFINCKFISEYNKQLLFYFNSIIKKKLKLI